jgi:hypothetical protein
MTKDRAQGRSTLGIKKMLIKHQNKRAQSNRKVITRKNRLKNLFGIAGSVCLYILP